MIINKKIEEITKIGKWIYIDNKENFVVNISQAWEWIHNFGFRKYMYNEKSYDYILIKNNIVEIVNDTTLKNIITECVKEYATLIKFTENLDEDSKKISEKIISSYDKAIPRLFDKKRFECYLTPIDKENFLKDTSTTSYFCFNNGIVEISKKKFEIKKYDDIKKYIWKKRIINRDYDISKSNGEIGVFEQFCKNICTNKNINIEVDETRFKALQCVIGYLLHSYRNDGNKAIILSEANIKEGQNGGTGKSLLLKAINQLRYVLAIDISKIKDDKYLFGEVQPGITDIIFLDECHKRFKLSEYFSVISGDLHINEKYGKKITIKDKESPKLAMATNYAITSIDVSTKRRIYEFELFVYYNNKFTPDIEFGSYFWSEDWTECDWIDFYIFMLNCSRIYFENDKKLPEYFSDTKQIKKISNYSCPELLEFMQNKLEKCNYNLIIKTSELYNEFKTSYEEYNYITNNQFSYWIRQYCEVYNLEYKKQNVYENTKTVRYYNIKRTVDFNL